MNNAALLSYVFCALVSGACAFLLWRSWRRTRAGIVGASAGAFGLLFVSNVVLVVDLFTAADLAWPRAIFIAAGLAWLIYALIAGEGR